MTHDKAIERVQALIGRCCFAVEQDRLDAEALETLLAAVSHMPVGGNGEPLWPGLVGWRRVTKKQRRKAVPK